MFLTGYLINWLRYGVIPFYHPSILLCAGWALLVAVNVLLVLWYIAWVRVTQDDHARWLWAQFDRTLFAPVMKRVADAHALMKHSRRALLRGLSVPHDAVQQGQRPQRRSHRRVAEEESVVGDGDGDGDDQQHREQKQPVVPAPGGGGERALTAVHRPVHLPPLRRHVGGHAGYEASGSGSGSGDVSGSGHGVRRAAAPLQLVPMTPSAGLDLATGSSSGGFDFLPAPTSAEVNGRGVRRADTTNGWVGPSPDADDLSGVADAVVAVTRDADDETPLLPALPEQDDAEMADVHSMIEGLLQLLVTFDAYHPPTLGHLKVSRSVFRVMFVSILGSVGGTLLTYTQRALQ